MKTIDLRSDTVTRPTPEMRAAIARAEVGDDVYREDPSVSRLESLAADMVGQEAGLFVPSGTQGNLLGILSHCERGDEFVAGQNAHCYKYEAGGAAVLGSVQPQPVEFEPDGSLDLERVAQVIKPIDSHFARTRLLCLENTQGGKVLSLDYLDRATGFAREHGLGLHLDGARVMNAAVKLGVAPERIGGAFDTVSICLSKGLGAPVGSVLAGKAGHIERARRWRKMVGGGMRQAGVLAAAGILALEQHVERLAQDHENARRLAEGLTSLAGLEVTGGREIDTNMVFVTMPQPWLEDLSAFMDARGVRVKAARPMRLVTHLDVSAEAVEHTIEAMRAFVASRTNAAA